MPVWQEIQQIFIKYFQQTLIVCLCLLSLYTLLPGQGRTQLSLPSVTLPPTPAQAPSPQWSDVPCSDLLSRDWVTSTHDCYPNHTVPFPHCPSCRWWAYVKALLLAVLGWVPWAKTLPPGTLLWALTLGQAQGWGLGNVSLGDVTVLDCFFFIGVFWNHLWSDLLPRTCLGCETLPTTCLLESFWYSKEMCMFQNKQLPSIDYG